MHKVKNLFVLFFILFFLLILVNGCGTKLVSPEDVYSPTNLKLSYLNNSHIKLEWDYTPADGDTVYYMVYKNYGGSGWYTIEDNTSNKYWIDSVIESDSLVYAYKVSAYSVTLSEESAYSEIVAYFPDNSAPLNISATQFSHDHVRVTWDYKALGQEGFYLDRKIGDGDWDVNSVRLTADSRSYIDDAYLFKNVSYRIKAYTGTSVSDYKETTIYAKLISPSDLTLTKLDDNKIRLDWVDNSIDETNFIIDRKIGETDWEENHAIVDSNQTHYIDEINNNAITLSYRIKSKNNDGDSDYSDIASINIFFDLIGDITTSGEAVSVKVKDWIAFVADEYEGLIEIDCSNPSNPYIIETNLTFPDRTKAIDFEENFAYIVSHGFNSESGAVNIVDFSDYEAPVHFASFLTGDQPNDIIVNGDYAYVANGETGLSIYYITTSQPLEISNVPLEGIARKITYSNQKIYVSNGLSGMYSVDVSSAQNPQQLGFISADGLINDIAVNNNHCFIADGEAGIKIIDVTSPGNETVISQISTNGFAYGISYDNEKLFVVDKERGIISIDISDLSNPKIVGILPLQTEPNSIFIYGSYAFVTDNEGLKIIKIKI